MEKLEIPVAQVEKLLELVDTHDLEELTVEDGDLTISIKGRAFRARVQAFTAQPHQPPHASHVGAHAAAHQEMHISVEAEPHPEVEHDEPEEEADGNIVDITAPLVGVFYRSPAPDAPPFVDVGDMIEVGTEVGLIEAMKVFSPIPSEVNGEVIEIPAENGKLVQQGDVLVRVRVSQEEAPA